MFFFAYTQVKTNAQNNGFTCAISFCLVSSAPSLSVYPLPPQDTPSSHSGDDIQPSPSPSAILGVMQAQVPASC